MSSDLTIIQKSIRDSLARNAKSDKSVQLQAIAMKIGVDKPRVVKELEEMVAMGELELPEGACLNTASAIRIESIITKGFLINQHELNYGNAVESDEPKPYSNHLRLDGLTYRVAVTEEKKGDGWTGRYLLNIASFEHDDDDLVTKVEDMPFDSEQDAHAWAKEFLLGTAPEGLPPFHMVIAAMQGFKLAIDACEPTTLDKSICEYAGISPDAAKALIEDLKKAQILALADDEDEDEVDGSGRIGYAISDAFDENPDTVIALCLEHWRAQFFMDIDGSTLWYQLVLAGGDLEKLSRNLEILSKAENPVALSSMFHVQGADLESFSQVLADLGLMQVIVEHPTPDATVATIHTPTDLERMLLDELAGLPAEEEKAS